MLCWCVVSVSVRVSGACSERGPFVSLWLTFECDWGECRYWISAFSFHQCTQTLVYLTNQYNAANIMTKKVKRYNTHASIGTLLFMEKCGCWKWLALLVNRLKGNFLDAVLNKCEKKEVAFALSSLLINFVTFVSNDKVYKKIFQSELFLSLSFSKTGQTGAVKTDRRHAEWLSAMQIITYLHSVSFLAVRQITIWKWARKHSGRKACIMIFTYITADM